MIPIPTGVRVWLATGTTDMRRGMNGLALQVQQMLGLDPHAGDLYVFRGKRGDLIKVLWHDGLGMRQRGRPHMTDVTARPSSGCCRTGRSRSAWTGAAPGGTTYSSSGCGAR